MRLPLRVPRRIYHLIGPSACGKVAYLTVATFDTTDMVDYTALLYPDGQRVNETDLVRCVACTGEMDQRNFRQMIHDGGVASPDHFRNEVDRVLKRQLYEEANPRA